MSDEAQRTPSNATTRNGRHWFVSSLSGAAIGLAIWIIVFALLRVLSPLVITPNVDPNNEGKGGHVVEILWFWLGAPMLTMIGFLWPHTIGRLFRRSKSSRTLD